MKNAQSISIVIPVYNEEDYLKACLDAVALQSVKPLEVVVVDNNSTDKSIAIAEKYPFVRVVKEKKQGIVFARSKGFNSSKGTIIARIDADTIIPTDWISNIAKFYSNKKQHHNALTGGGYFYNMRLPRFNGWVQSQLAYRMNRFITGHYILWGSNMAMPRDIWSKIKNELCTDQAIHEDMDLAIHVHMTGYNITYLAKQIRVGVKLRRVLSARNELHGHMQRWPNTLKSHGYKLWWMGVLGNLLLWYVIQPFIFISEGVARLFGKRRYT